MSSTLTSSFHHSPTPQTTDTYSPAIAGYPSRQAELLSAAQGGRRLGSDWNDGRKYKTRSGIYVRSKIEKIIAGSHGQD